MDSAGFLYSPVLLQLMVVDLPNINWRFVLIATSKSTTFGAKVNSQVIGPLHDLIQAIELYIGKKLNGKNQSVFKFGFVAHLIRYDLINVLIDDEAGKTKSNKIYSILIAALKSSQFVLVNKSLTPAQMRAALKSFYRKKRGQSIRLLTQKF